MRTTRLEGRPRKWSKSGRRWWQTKRKTKSTSRKSKSNTTRRWKRSKSVRSPMRTKSTTTGEECTMKRRSPPFKKKLSPSQQKNPNLSPSRKSKDRHPLRLLLLPKSRTSIRRNPSGNVRIWTRRPLLLPRPPTKPTKAVPPTRRKRAAKIKSETGNPLPQAVITKSPLRPQMGPRPRRITIVIKTANPPPPPPEARAAAAAKAARPLQEPSSPQLQTLSTTP